MAAWAKVGVQCVCIKDEWRPALPPNVRVPRLKDVLTIDGVHWIGGLVFLTFVEFPALQQVGDMLGLVGFDATAFKPLVPLEDDVALFAHLLTSTKIEEKV